VPKITFSDVGLRNLSPPEQGQVAYWDDRLPAFGLRVSQGGSKTFILKRHNCRITIGRYGVITLADARAEARRMLAEFTLGKIRPQSITYPQAVKLFVEDHRGGLQMAPGAFSVQGSTLGYHHLGYRPYAQGHQIPLDL
jgi:hypothetical protein